MRCGAMYVYTLFPMSERVPLFPLNSNRIRPAAGRERTGRHRQADENQGEMLNSVAK